MINDVTKLREWLENSQSFEEIWNLGMDSFNEIHKGEGFTYGMNYNQWWMMVENFIATQGVGGGFAQTPFPFKDPAEST